MPAPQRFCSLDVCSSASLADRGPWPIALARSARTTHSRPQRRRTCSVREPRPRLSISRQNVVGRGFRMLAKREMTAFVEYARVEKLVLGVLLTAPSVFIQQLLVKKPSAGTVHSIQVRGRPVDVKIALFHITRRRFPSSPRAIPKRRSRRMGSMTFPQHQAKRRPSRSEIPETGRHYLACLPSCGRDRAEKASSTRPGGRQSRSLFPIGAR